MLERLFFYVRHSLNDLRVNGQRTIFALLCIAAGVASIVSLQTLGVMIEDSLTGSLQESNRSDIRVYAQDGGENNPLVQQGQNQGFLATNGTFETVYITVSGPRAGLKQLQEWLDRRYPDQEAVLTYRQSESSLTSGLSISLPDRDTQKVFVVPTIVEADRYPLYGRVRSVDGRDLSELLVEPTDIVINEDLAEDLDAQVGDRVQLSGASADFTLRGIVPNDSEQGFENFAAALFGYYYLDTSAVKLFSDMSAGAEMVYIRLKDPSQVDAINKALLRQYPFLDSTTTTDLEELNSDISKYLNQLVVVMGLVSLLIGGIGIVNTMLVIVSRRTTEVAVLKTIGLQGNQVTVLFLVEAVLMGIFGSLFGIVLGWLGAYAIKGVAGAFLTQTLTFHITPTPALTGFVVGVIVTAIFGFLPTLAAGQVRPNLVLRPSDTVIPKAGRALSLVALLLVMAGISLVAQALVRDLLDDNTLRAIAQQLGGGLGLLAGLAMVGSGIFAGWTRRRLPLRILRWALLLAVLPLVGMQFGSLVPAILILTGTFLVVGVLYVLLWVLIWSFGGGSLRDLWLLKLRRRSSRALTFVLGIACLPVWIINAAVVVIAIPFWLLGRVIQRLAFVDLRLALRSMLANKGRGASTLLALVVGVFTLSLITMLAKAITNRFEQVLVDETGGNVIILAAGSTSALDAVNERLDTLDGVKSHATVGVYDVELLSAYDVSLGRKVSFEALKYRAENRGSSEGNNEGTSLDFALSSLDAREIGPNLPNVKFYQGRQLDARDVGPWDSAAGEYPPIVISGYQSVIDSGLEVGDRLTYRFSPDDTPGFQLSTEAEEVVITFEIVGIVDRRQGNIAVNFSSPNYAPLEAFPAGLSPQFISSVVDIDETQIRPLRRSMAEIPGVFVLETKMLNDLVNKIIERFTSFPILVAGLALVVGGIVIANSVALSTLERRREIAIMKAVGLQRERVLGMLLLEYGLMGLIGGLIGVGLGGIGLLWMLVSAFGGELGKTIPYTTALGLMTLCVLIALAAAVITAWGASGEKPLNVLRYE